MSKIIVWLMFFNKALIKPLNLCFLTKWSEARYRINDYRHPSWWWASSDLAHRWQTLFFYRSLFGEPVSKTVSVTSVNLYSVVRAPTNKFYGWNSNGSKGIPHVIINPMWVEWNFSLFFKTELILNIQIVRQIPCERYSTYIYQSHVGGMEF